MIIYAASNDYLKDIPVEKLKEFEKGFYEFMDIHHKEVERCIHSDGQLSEAAETELKAGIEEYKKLFSEKQGE